MGGLIIAAGWRGGSDPTRPERTPRPATAFAVVVGLTLVNPTTVVYFTALVAGGGLVAAGTAAQVAFIAGALLASSAWQLTLASLGKVAGGWVTGQQGRRWAAVVGGGLVILLAAWTLVG
jgi:threonine/homoserine/homoserine lactone efflux protein